MLNLITLISNNDNPLYIRIDELKGSIETKSQYAGLIFSTNPDDDGLRRTRVNKSKLNKVRTAKKDLNYIEMEIWCKDTDTDFAKSLLIADFKDLIKAQDDFVNEFNELQTERKTLLNEL